MKYLLIKDKRQQQHALIDNIAEFLWNNGNEIYVRTCLDKTREYQDIINQCECIVFLNCSNDLMKSFFNDVKNVLAECTQENNILNKKFVLFFLINGVYCNAVPFPHKIFHFKELSQHELTRFFLWCEGLKLFVR